MDRSPGASQEVAGETRTRVSSLGMVLTLEASRGKTDSYGVRLEVVEPQKTVQRGVKLTDTSEAAASERRPLLLVKDPPLWPLHRPIRPGTARLHTRVLLRNRLSCRSGPTQAADSRGRISIGLTARSGRTLWPLRRDG